jgi:hypothetical protein
VVFPDHERCLADMTAFLAGGSDDDEPVGRVCLRRRFAARREGIVQADVLAAAVVAAHNNALRSWLRSDGRDEAGAAVDHALAYVRSAFGGGRCRRWRSSRRAWWSS